MNSLKINKEFAIIKNSNNKPPKNPIFPISSPPQCAASPNNPQTCRPNAASPPPPSPNNIPNPS